MEEISAQAIEKMPKQSRMSPTTYVLQIVPETSVWWSLRLLVEVCSVELRPSVAVATTEVVKYTSRLTVKRDSLILHQVHAGSRRTRR
jgi:hypothetical protein